MIGIGAANDLDENAFGEVTAQLENFGRIGIVNVAAVSNMHQKTGEMEQRRAQEIERSLAGFGAAGTQSLGTSKELEAIVQRINAIETRLNQGGTPGGNAGATARGYCFPEGHVCARTVRPTARRAGAPHKDSRPKRCANTTPASVPHTPNSHPAIIL